MEKTIEKDRVISILCKNPLLIQEFPTKEITQALLKEFEDAVHPPETTEEEQKKIFVGETPRQPERKETEEVTLVTVVPATITAEFFTKLFGM